MTGSLERIFIGTVLVVISAMTTSAQTLDLQFWVQNLNFALTASTNGAVRTNGIVARINSGATRITSRDLIRELSGRGALTVSKGFATNLTGEITAVPVYSEAPASSYSSQAKLLVMQQLGQDPPAEPLIIIRDGHPAVDYVVNRFFILNDISFDGRLSPVVTKGRIDIEHDLVDTTDSLVRQFRFDVNAFTAAPAETYFDVQGFTTQRHISPLRDGTPIDHNVTGNFNASVAGTGQIGSPESFAVLRGTISTSGGRVESK